MFSTTPSFNFFARLVLKALWPSVGRGRGRGRRRGGGEEGARDLLAIAHSLPGFTNNRRFSYVEINSENPDGYMI